MAPKRPITVNNGRGHIVAGVGDYRLLIRPWSILRAFLKRVGADNARPLLPLARVNFFAHLDRSLILVKCLNLAENRFLVFLECLEFLLMTSGSRIEGSTVQQGACPRRLTAPIPKKYSSVDYTHRNI